MKKQDIIRLIRAKAEKDMPDVLSKINLDTIEIIPETRPEKRRSWNLSRILSYSLSMIAFSIIAAFGINYLATNPTTNYTPLDNETEIIGFQAVSAASLLDSMDLTDLSYNIEPMALVTTDSFIESELPTIDQYLNMLEVTLGKTDAITYEAIASDREGYAYCIQIQSSDLTQNTYNFRFYFNRTDAVDETGIEGVIAYDDREFALNGTLYKSTGPIRSSFRAQIDAENYVNVEDRSTDTAQSFAYRIVKHGILTNESVLNVESVREHFQVSIQMMAQGKHLSMKVKKSATNDSFTIGYEVSNDTVDESGEIDVSLVYDNMMGKFVYRYNVRNNQSTGQSEFHGNRKWWQTNTTTTTTMIPDTDTTTNPGSGSNPTTTAPANTQTDPTQGSSGPTTSENTAPENTMPGQCPWCHSQISPIYLEKI